MARPIKNGLDYFPMDVDIFDDEKIIGVSMKYGVAGEMVAIRLLCAIYRDGYYATWQRRMKWRLTRQMPGLTEEQLDEIVQTLVDDGFFDKTLFQLHGVLTSRGIQQRYFTSKRKKDKDMEELPYVISTQPNTQPNTHPLPKGDTHPRPLPKGDTHPHPLPKGGEDHSKGGEDKTIKIDYERFKQCWNKTLGDYHSVISHLQVMTDDRKAALQQLLEKGYTSNDMWKVMRAAASSPQLNGRTKKSFIPGYDWIMREENFVRILEGEFNAKTMV